MNSEGWSYEVINKRLVKSPTKIPETRNEVWGMLAGHSGSIPLGASFHMAVLQGR